MIIVISIREIASPKLFFFEMLYVSINLNSLHLTCFLFQLSLPQQVSFCRVSQDIESEVLVCHGTGEKN